MHLAAQLVNQRSVQHGPTEKFMAKEVNPEQREQDISEPYEIEGWTGFNFPAKHTRRQDKHKQCTWFEFTRFFHKSEE